MMMEYYPERQRERERERERNAFLSFTRSLTTRQRIFTFMTLSSAAITPKRRDEDFIGFGGIGGNRNVNILSKYERPSYLG